MSVFIHSFVRELPRCCQCPYRISLFTLRKGKRAQSIEFTCCSADPVIPLPRVAVFQRVRASQCSAVFMQLEGRVAMCPCCGGGGQKSEAEVKGKGGIIGPWGHDRVSPSIGLLNDSRFF